MDPILNGASKIGNKIVQLGLLSIHRVSRHGLNMDQYIGRVDYISKDMICISPTYSINVSQMWMSEKTQNSEQIKIHVESPYEQNVPQKVDIKLNSESLDSV